MLMILSGVEDSLRIFLLSKIGSRGKKWIPALRSGISSSQGIELSLDTRVQGIVHEELTKAVSKYQALGQVL